jgi:hypothetical protein
LNFGNILIRDNKIFIIDFDHFSHGDVEKDLAIFWIDILLGLLKEVKGELIYLARKYVSFLKKHINIKSWKVVFLKIAKKYNFPEETFRQLLKLTVVPKVDKSIGSQNSKID